MDSAPAFLDDDTAMAAKRGVRSPIDASVMMERFPGGWVDDEPG